MRRRTLLLPIVMLIMIAGCTSKSSQIAELATRDAERQSRLNEKLLELERRVAQGAQELITADAVSRREIASLQRDLQTERSVIGRQRDQLEAERRIIATQRRTEPLYTAAINVLVIFAVVIGPLILCAVLLRRVTEPVESAALTELFIEDAIRKEPILRLTSSEQLLLGRGSEPINSEDRDESSQTQALSQTSDF